MGEARGGARHVIKAFGVEEMLREHGYEPSQELMDEFPEATLADLRRTSGEVDLLLRMDVVGIHPTEVRTVGNCRLLQSQFGMGKLIVGNVPGDRCGEVNATATKYARGSWDVSEESVAFVHAALQRPAFDDLEELQPE